MELYIQLQKLSIKSFGDVYKEIRSSILPNNSSFFPQSIHPPPSFNCELYHLFILFIFIFFVSLQWSWKREKNEMIWNLKFLLWISREKSFSLYSQFHKTLLGTILLSHVNLGKVLWNGRYKKCFIVCRSVSGSYPSSVCPLTICKYFMAKMVVNYGIHCIKSSPFYNFSPFISR